MKKIAFEFDSGYNLPKIPATNWERVFKKYKPEPLLVDLISKILVFDTDKRLTQF